MVVFGQSGCNRVGCFYSSKVAVFGQKWLSLGKRGYVLAIVVVFGQIGCIPSKWLYSGKVGCIQARLLYSCKVVVFEKKWL